MDGRTTMTATGPTTDGRTYTVGELASLARVSVRTLHHYDAIGLLRPSERTAAGYRRYGHDDLELLQTINLEFGLPAESASKKTLIDQLTLRQAGHCVGQRTFRAPA